MVKAKKSKKAKKVKEVKNDDIKNIIENAPEIKSEPPQPLMRELPPANPFPLEVLGKLLGDAAKAIQDKTQAPIAICGQSVLAAATLAVQGHGDVCLPNGQKKPISSYYLTMAESGERKTACDTEALKPIRQHEEVLRNNYKLEIVQYNLAQEVWEGHRKGVVSNCIKEGKTKEEASAKVATDVGFAPTPPPIPIKTYPEATYEGLVKLLDKGHASIGLFSSEGGQFIGGHGMVPEAKLRTATGLSSIWDGEPIKRVRGGDGVQFINGKRLAAHLMCQPEVACLILNDEMLAGQGLLSRMLITAPDSTAGSRRWKKPSDKSAVTLEKYGKHIGTIMSTPLPLVFGTNNELAPPIIALTKEALDAWVEFHDATEKALAPDGEYASIKSMANKLPEHAIRLAAVLAMVEDIKAKEIKEVHMVAGIKLATHYAKEALRLFGASRIKSELHMADRISKWLKTSWKEPAISVVDIYQRSPIVALRDKAKASQVVNILAEHGHLIPCNEPVIIAGKRRRQAWLINRIT